MYIYREILTLESRKVDLRSEKLEGDLGDDGFKHFGLAYYTTNLYNPSSWHASLHVEVNLIYIHTHIFIYTATHTHFYLIYIHTHPHTPMTSHIKVIFLQTKDNMLLLGSPPTKDNININIIKLISIACCFFRKPSHLHIFFKGIYSFI